MAGRCRPAVFRLVAFCVCVCFVAGQRKLAKILARRILPGGTVEVGVAEALGWDCGTKRFHNEQCFAKLPS